MVVDAHCYFVRHRRLNGKDFVTVESVFYRNCTGGRTFRASVCGHQQYFWGRGGSAAKGLLLLTWWCQNDSKVIPKCIQNDPEMI